MKFHNCLYSNHLETVLSKYVVKVFQILELKLKFFKREGGGGPLSVPGLCTGGHREDASAPFLFHSKSGEVIATRYLDVDLIPVVVDASRHTSYITNITA